tara:strand:+ start:180 stop:1043 length:864 start_codon:yes stop_codon:yes gene_type:complete
MQNPDELSVHKFLNDVVDNKATMDTETIDIIVEDIREALYRQFSGGEDRSKFRLRMSNVGRPYCQLWFDKNKPETKAPKPNSFVMNMMFGDIIEAIFKGVLRAAGVKFKNSEHVTLQLSDNTQIEGTYDLVTKGVDDVKSASDWSYRNKFKDFATLDKDDPFGYVAQLAGYAKASEEGAGGWWVVNKNNGSFKYISANDMDVAKEIKAVEEKKKKLDDNVFERCYDAVPETYRKKETGNKVLNRSCNFCDYRYTCWPTLQEREAVNYSGYKTAPLVSYVEMKGEMHD